MNDNSKVMMYHDQEIKIRGGAWLDIMNSCFYDEVEILNDKWTVCRDRWTGELFALNIIR